MMDFKFLSFCFLVLLQIFFLNSSICRYEGQDYYFSSTRYYDPKSGQFTQPDTHTPRGFYDHLSLNRYLYAFGNPIKYNDPDGHSPQDPSDDLGTLRYINNAAQLYNLYLDSEQGVFAKLTYYFLANENDKDYRKYLGREVTTGIIVKDQPGVPNSGPKIERALQDLAGPQATIRAYEVINENRQKHWRVTYQQNVDQLNNGSYSAQAWRHLKPSLHASRSFYKPSDRAVSINLHTLESDEGQYIMNYLGAVGVASPPVVESYDMVGLALDTQPVLQLNPRDVSIFMISDLGNRYESRLSVTLGHELKHAENMITGKAFDHFYSPLEYIFNDDPIYHADNIYVRAHNNNNPEDIVLARPPTLDHLGGVGLRMGVFKNVFGFDPTKTTQKE